MTAYTEGWDAYYRGVKSARNPYRFGSNDYEMWAEGWRDAEFQDNTNQGSDGA